MIEPKLFSEIEGVQKISQKFLHGFGRFEFDGSNYLEKDGKCFQKSCQNDIFLRFQENPAKMTFFEFNFVLKTMKKKE